MIKTPIGEIILNINEKKKQYVAKELHPSFRKFKVDKRYQIELEIDKLRKNSTVELYINTDILISEDHDSDEGLFLSIYKYKNFTIGIGVDGDIKGITYLYKKNGIRLIINKCVIKKIKFNISWCTTNSENSYLSVWYGVDTNYDVEFV